jgi:hypothetical protein
MAWFKRFYDVALKPARRQRDSRRRHCTLGCDYTSTATFSLQDWSNDWPPLTRTLNSS